MNNVLYVSLSEFEQREQRQPVAGSYCQESGDRRESGGKYRSHLVKALVEKAAGRLVKHRFFLIKLRKSCK